MTDTYSGFLKRSVGIGAERMIISRMQDHIVQTSDGTLHMIVNKGLQQNLMILSSSDGGLTWDVTAKIPKTDYITTSDSMLLDDGESLLMTYVDDTGCIVVSVLHFDSATGLWGFESTSALTMPPVRAQDVHPSTGVSPDGTIWVAYTEATDSGIALCVAWSGDNGLTWSSSALAFDDLSNGSATVISTEGLTGFLVTSSDMVYWVTFAPDEGYEIEVIDDGGTIGEYASHLAATTYDGNIYVVNVQDDGQISFIRYNAETGQWEDPQFPIGTGPLDRATTAQISISSDGNLYIIYDDVKAKTLVVLESTDGGVSWHEEAVLATPTYAIAYPNRIEAPEYFEGDLVLVQQVEVPNSTMKTGLYYYAVDVDNNGLTIQQNMGLHVPTTTDAFIF